VELFRLEPGHQRGSFRLVGELDMTNVEMVQARLEEELGDVGTLILDASDLEFMDSQGLLMLIHLGEQAENRRETVHLVNCPQQVRRLLDVAVPRGIPGVKIERQNKGPLRGN
jgi:anti-anti-sigma factor